VASVSGSRSGRAIVREPRAFLFDEPLSNLDARLRLETRAELSRLHRRLGATMIYVTHDQVEAMTLGERVAVLKDGALQQVAAADGALQAAGESVRRRVHREPGDELHRGDVCDATATRAYSRRHG
jgi:multiple sugar transport system ATP-binding protein